MYAAILGGSFGLNEGMYYENVVAQELKAGGHGLFYCKFRHSSSERYQEVDFAIVRDNHIIPIEVKSGRLSKAHKSLDRFIDKYKDRVGTPVVLHTKNLEFDGKVLYLPIYMVSLL